MQKFNVVLGLASGGFQILGVNGRTEWSRATARKHGLDMLTSHYVSVGICPSDHAAPVIPVAPTARDKFVTSRGWLTHYALACGYREVVQDNPRAMALYLWHEGACFHVRLSCDATHKRIFWDSFDSLPEARAAFNAACKEWNLKRKRARV